MFITFSELAPVFVPQYLFENRNFVLIGTNEPKKEITFANMKTSPCFRLYHTERFCHGVWNVYMEFVNESAMDMSRFSTAPAYIDLKNLHESIKELTIRTSKPKAIIYSRPTSHALQPNWKNIVDQGVPT